MNLNQKKIISEEEPAHNNHLKIANLILLATSQLSLVVKEALKYLFKIVTLIKKITLLEKTLILCLLSKKFLPYHHKKKNYLLYKKWEKNIPKTITFSKYNNLMKKMNSISLLTPIKPLATISLKIILKQYLKITKKNEI
jgi:hypothetical protein